MKIVISGAGIGGLTAALCLSQEGHSVVICEQASMLSEVGAGIQLGANAVCVFESLGVLEQIIDVAVQPIQMQVRLFDSTEVLYQAEYGEAYQSEYGLPYLHIHRADLQAVLLKAIHASNNAELSLNSQVVSFSEKEKGVSVKLESGEIIEADLLVAADGIKSKVRKLIAGNSSPKYTGSYAWRGVIPRQKLPEDFMDKVVTNFVGPHKHMVIYYLRQQQLVNFVGVVESKGNRQSEVYSKSQPWVQQAPWQELKDDFIGWNDTVQTVINSVGKGSCYRWNLYHHKPVKNWSTNKVTLLGDAAHATLPFMASGAAMAVEDARILTRCLSEQNNIALALQMYQNNRFKRTRRVQRFSAQSGKIYNLPNKTLMKLAFKAVSLRSNNPDRWLPAYNANTVTLK